MYPNLGQRRRVITEKDLRAGRCRRESIGQGLENASGRMLYTQYLNTMSPNRIMKSQNPFHAVLAAILATASEGKEAGSKAITFSEHIAPIVFDNCVSLPSAERGSSFFADELSGHSEAGQLIATVVEDRYMPPWHASSKDYEFEGHRALSEQEIELISDWVDSGMAEGDPLKVPDLPRFTDGWQLGEPDLVVSMREGYKLYAEGPGHLPKFCDTAELERG